MTRREAWAVVAHGVPTIGLLLQGLLYVATSRFMPYHAEALGGITWEELQPHYQAFVLGVIKAMGAGSIGVTVALIIMLSIPFRRGDRWTRWAVPTVGIAFTALTAYAAFTIDVHTPASTPWRQTAFLSLLYLVGGLASYWPFHRDSARQRDSRA